MNEEIMMENTLNEKTMNEKTMNEKTMNENTANDPYRPVFHFSVKKGWMNDPNGLIYYKGRYHMFYQHNPYAPVWGPMHWGHATSRDLIHWKHEPIALLPDQEYEAHKEVGGCFSGSAIEKDGKMYLIYTGCVQDRKPSQCQAVAVSEDGYSFGKYINNPVIAASPAECTEEFRDPKIWEKDGVYYCVIGTQSEDLGRVLLYRSYDIYQWEYVGIVAKSNGQQGDMWECPDLCTFENHDVLIYSPIHAAEGDTRYFSGKINYTTGELGILWDKILDYGPNFYAPQSFTDKTGRRILFGWMRCWEEHMPCEPYGWAGQLTLPRRLWADSCGILHQEPVKELEALRRNETGYELSGIKDMQLQAIESSCYELELTAEGEEINSFTLFLRCSENRSEQTVLHFDTKQNLVSVDRTNAGEGEKGCFDAPFLEEDNKSYRLQLFVDHNSLELFTSQNTVSMCFYLWADPRSTGIYYESDSGQNCSITAKIWELADKENIS